MPPGHFRGVALRRYVGLGTPPLGVKPSEPGPVPTRRGGMAAKNLGQTPSEVLEPLLAAIARALATETQVDVFRCPSAEEGFCMAASDDSANAA